MSLAEPEWGVNQSKNPRMERREQRSLRMLVLNWGDTFIFWYSVQRRVRWLMHSKSRSVWFKINSPHTVKNALRRRSFTFSACDTRLDLIQSNLKNEWCQWFNRMLWCLPSNSLTPPLLLSLCLTLSSSQIQSKSARAIAMVTESVILVCATASQDSTAWTAPKVYAAYKCVSSI